MSRSMKLRGVSVIMVFLMLFSVPAKGWNVWKDTDPMTDIVRGGVASHWTSPKREMSSPYNKTRAIIGMSCNGRGAYMRFTNTPNLSGDEIRNGYNRITMRMRFNKDKFIRSTFTQIWGSDQLSTDNALVRDRLLKANTLLIEIPWHGQGGVLFEFNLAGSSAAFQRVCTEELAREAERKRKIEEADARRKASLEKAERAREERFWNYKNNPETARKHIESQGWKCSSIEEEMIVDVDLYYKYFMNVICSDGMEYRVWKNIDRVDSLRNSGRRL